MSHNDSTIKITVSGNKAIAKALSAAIDDSKCKNGEFIIEYAARDMGDMRARLNSTLRVINAALESMEKVK
ncbi:MAG: hypothetical protein JRN26_02635 [Nitrososphaerota archaeon]|jgi:hypothetical protein|nr:CTAG/PCC1 family protein [Nitrososphaerota archaeon]MDG6927337.1 hypothetical protein [Nitrososphaerota archaeon]MDG6930935.1 hypothetical protein [Nitrososphaerota archaeon]MDG6932235.1 hypothetical protein [Nitrososphaerota archaeon]MDG6935772.1 hypothetical protein [Nitrososphaerota archaeon]